MTREKAYKSLKQALDALKSLPPADQEILLKNLLKRDPELVRQLKENLFEFNDISGLAKADFKFLWFEIPRQTWLMALRAAPDEVLLFIRSCQSERAFNQLIDDLKALGPQPLSKVQQAQSLLLAEIRSLAQQGRVHLPGGKH